MDIVNNYRCPRCGDLMYFDSVSSTDPDWYQVKCSKCGVTMIIKSEQIDMSNLGNHIDISIEPKEYLFYVTKYNITKNDYELCIYKVSTRDPFHTMGEFIYTSTEHIKSIQFTNCTRYNIQYWKEHNFEIQDYKEVYAIGGIK